MIAGGVVLAGGRSSRMGTSKALLEWHGSTLLRRVVGLVQRGVDGPVVVVAAADQELPPLPAAVDVVHDARPGRGPLAGIAVGLTFLGDQVDAAFVCATDMPLLTPSLVRRIVRQLGAADIALPQVDGFDQPLGAAYRTHLGKHAEVLLEEGQGRVALLQQDAAVVRLDHAALRQPTGLRGMNDPATYAELRALPAPRVVVHRTGALARPTTTDTPHMTVHAATLGAAAVAVGLALDRHLLAAIGGDAVVRDPDTPLAEGDEVSFLSADAGG